MAYTLPTAAALKTRYPAFSAVADATVDVAIADAALRIDETWPENQYQPGIMELAAHFLSVQGLGSGTEAALAGIKSLSVGSLSLTSASDGGMGSYKSTSYGREYLQRVRLLFPPAFGV